MAAHPEGYIVNVESVIENTQVHVFRQEYAPRVPSDDRIEGMMRYICMPYGNNSFVPALSPALRNARAKGWRFLWSYLIPEAFRPLRMVRGIIEVICALLLLTMAITLLSVNKSPPAFYNFGLLGVSLAWLLLSIVQTTICLVFSLRASRRQQNNPPVGTDEVSLLEGENRSMSCSPNGKPCKWRGILYFAFTEMHVYLLVVLSLIGVIHKRAYNFKTVEHFILNMSLFLAFIALILCVFVAQFLVVGWAIYLTRKLCNFLPDLRRSLVHSHACFTLYSVGQVATLILILATIGARFHYDNLDTASYSPRLSHELIFMIGAGFFIHSIGLWMFFITSFYWVLEFTIVLCMNVLSALQTPECMEAIQHVTHQDSEEIQQKIHAVVTYMNPRAITSHLRVLQHHPSIVWKVLNPGLSPSSIFICIAYTTFVGAFIICSIHAHSSIAIILASSIGWKILFGFLAIVAFVTNVTAFAVAMFWVGVVVLIVVVIVGICVVTRGRLFIIPGVSRS